MSGKRATTLLLPATCSLDPAPVGEKVRIPEFCRLRQSRAPRWQQRSTGGAPQAPVNPSTFSSLTVPKGVSGESSKNGWIRAPDPARSRPMVPWTWAPYSIGPAQVGPPEAAGQVRRQLAQQVRRHIPVDDRRLPVVEPTGSQDLPSRPGPGSGLAGGSRSGVAGLGFLGRSLAFFNCRGHRRPGGLGRHRNGTKKTDDAYPPLAQGVYKLLLVPDRRRLSATGPSAAVRRSGRCQAGLCHLDDGRSAIQRERKRPGRGSVRDPASGSSAQAISG